MLDAAVVLKKYGCVRGRKSRRRRSSGGEWGEGGSEGGGGGVDEYLNSIRGETGEL
jgi:uncharacterized membrane protein YgcG